MIENLPVYKSAWGEDGGYASPDRGSFGFSLSTALRNTLPLWTKVCFGSIADLIQLINPDRNGSYEEAERECQARARNDSRLQESKSHFRAAGQGPALADDARRESRTDAVHLAEEAGDPCGC